MADNPGSPEYFYNASDLSLRDQTVDMLWAGMWCGSCLKKEGSGGDQRCSKGLQSPLPVQGGDQKVLQGV